MTGLFQRVTSKIAVGNSSQDANEDLLPSPPEARNWTWYNYSSLWAGQALDASWWSVGLFKPDDTASLNATFGAYYHVGFPVMIRPTFGSKGSKWFVVLRGLIGIVWYAIQVYYAAEMMNVMWICIFGSRYINWTPAVPASAGTDAKTILNYFLAWSVSLPLAMLHPSNLRPVFTARVILAFAAFFTMFVWCTVLGQTDPNGFKGFAILQPTPISGSSLGWASMSAINSVLATVAPMITNQSDVSRYAKAPRHAGWPQGVTIFVSKSVFAFFSIIAAASLQSRYGGEAKWGIWQQLQLLLEENWDGKTRFGCFFIAVGVAYSVMVTNAYCNSVPFGADIAALFPRYFTIVRGQIFMTLVSLPVLPWQILTNFSPVLTFLGSYTFLMGALLGCQWGDFLIRKGNYHVRSMFDKSPSSIYVYSKGYNWRGFAAWFVSFALIFPGLVAAYIPEKMDASAHRIYNMGWIISVVLSGATYYAINRLFPVPIVPEEYKDSHEAKKWLGMGEIHGVFPGETVEGVNTSSDDGSSIAEDEKTKDPVAVYSVAA
ncbi:Allantoin permease [Psilocybe cubensis]|uniref:Allantoin permease n=1 Tax=Psilocybe cubensis TaxID=181762 RepID=A0ACB8HI62_PSICU|nr:Allantoin permease [Psilocybe cubensis]KAH9487256.1 Allantoin permease [Psilocybe cubensis]